MQSRTSSQGRVLFIGHEATRTGAPIVLLHLLRWLKAHSDISFSLILRRGGELEEEYRALAPVFVMNQTTSLTKRAVRSGLFRLGFYEQAEAHLLKELDGWIKRSGVSLIYSNTATNGRLLQHLSKFERPVISHIHELEYSIQYVARPEEFALVQSCTTFYIAASEAVKRNLVENHGIPKEKIQVIYEFVPTESPDEKIQAQTRSEIRRQLSIPDEAIIVGGCGTIDWRKGPDLFIQLAKAVHQRQPGKEVHFIWVGGESAGPRWGELSLDINNLGLNRYVRFIGKKVNPQDYFAAFDIFAMVSREDPYPLVNLEVAAAGSPIICFERAGGTEEFVEDDSGFVVPYLDIEAMAGKVVKLVECEKLRRSLGERAAEKVRSRHDVGVTAPQVLEVIEQFRSQTAGFWMKAGYAL